MMISSIKVIVYPTRPSSKWDQYIIFSLPSINLFCLFGAASFAEQPVLDEEPTEIVVQFINQLLLAVSYPMR